MSVYSTGMDLFENLVDSRLQILPGGNGKVGQCVMANFECGREISRLVNVVDDPVFSVYISDAVSDTMQDTMQGKKTWRAMDQGGALAM